MKLIIAGGRNITSKEVSLALAAKCVELGFHGDEPGFNSGGTTITEVVSGGCRGVDELGEEWAACQQIKVKTFYADWDTHGRAAGPIRNRDMARYGAALLLIWDGKSKGSASMKRSMEKQGKPVYEVIIT